MAKDQKQKIMNALGCSEVEAEEIMQTDKAIDRGERVYFDLSPEQEKQAKKLINATTRKKPANYQFAKRERKAKPTKADIIQYLFDSLHDGYECSDLEITNKERQLIFAIGEDKFELTLIQKRKPKNK